MILIRDVNRPKIKLIWVFLGNIPACYKIPIVHQCRTKIDGSLVASIWDQLCECYFSMSPFSSCQQICLNLSGPDSIQK